MQTLLIPLVFLSFVLFIYIINQHTNEKFGNFFFPTRVECSTRNMSYDLRGEAYFPPRTNFPFDNSELGPSNQRCYPKRIIT
jgi:hypothetical protein